MAIKMSEFMKELRALRAGIDLKSPWREEKTRCFSPETPGFVRCLNPVSRQQRRHRRPQVEQRTGPELEVPDIGQVERQGEADGRHQKSRD